MNKKIEYIIPMRFILEAFARRDFYLQHTVEKDVISTLPLFIFSEISHCARISRFHYNHNEAVLNGVK